ncbi:MAG: hypothetical protein ACK55I_22035 [bacterium]
MPSRDNNISRAPHVPRAVQRGGATGEAGATSGTRQRKSASSQSISPRRRSSRKSMASSGRS